MFPRRKVVAVVGDGANPHREKATPVGEWIAQSGHHLLTGGGGGVMAAVNEVFVESAGRKGVAIGIIPGSINHRGNRFEYRTKGWAYPNPDVEVAVFTHLPGEDAEGERSRNHINVLSADLVVGLPGGVGTHAEIQLSKRYGKPALLFLSGSDMIHGKTVGDLAGEGFKIIHDFPALIDAGNRILDPERADRRPCVLPITRGVVRSWRWDDAEALAKNADNRNVWKNLFDGFPSPYTMRDARRWLAHTISSWPETVFAIDVDGEAVGAIGFYLKDGSLFGAAEIGYWLAEEHWGHGIATEALRTVTTHCFKAFSDVRRIYATVFEWNPGSMRVLEKAGYEREGVLRQGAVKNGRVIDLVQYSTVRLV